MEITKIGPIFKLQTQVFSFTTYGKLQLVMTVITMKEMGQATAKRQNLFGSSVVEKN